MLQLLHNFHRIRIRIRPDALPQGVPQLPRSFQALFHCPLQRGCLGWLLRCHVGGASCHGLPEG